jgi:LuxR family maltose regulon positive regulatory protein
VRLDIEDETMLTPVLVTKLYIPPPRLRAITRRRLIERLEEGLHRPLTLVSAPAGFGKTTLVSEWVTDCGRPVAWLSLDEADNDLARFLTYLVAALQTVVPTVGVGVAGALQSLQPPPTDSVLTALLNEITTLLPDDFALVLDDYHAIDAKPVDDALIFLLEHRPPQMHLVITTREDPQLPLARLRARGQLTELRAADLRFTASEVAEFLNRVMGLTLSAADIAALENRTEGWIAGLQLAAISMQGRQDATRFIQSFTGSHRFVMDYLVDEVLNQQPDRVQEFLLRTSILDQLCGPLCDAVVLDPLASGQDTLERIDRANLFLVPLDNERRWYRYHHLFAELLRQRLHHGAPSSAGEEGSDVAELHRRASVWYEHNGLEVEAFRHAAAAHDVARAERLIEGEGLPLQFRGANTPVLNWLESLPTTALDATPSLWITYAWTLLFSGQHTAVEQKLQAAEAVLQGTEPAERINDLLGRIASMRATLAVIQDDAETIRAQSHRALEFLHPDNRLLRTATTWSLGYAYQLQGDRAAASHAYADVIAAAKSLGDSIYTIAATINLAQVQESDNQLALATRTYRRVLQLAGDPPQPIACVAHLGLARIAYQWNDLDSAQQHGQQCFDLTQQMESVATFPSYAVLLAHIRLAQGDELGAAAVLAEAEAFVLQHHFVRQMPEVAAAQVLTLLRQGHLAAAAHLAQTHDLPISQARVHLATRNSSTALATLEPLRQQAEAKGWQDERLKVMVLQALAHQAHGDKDTAVRLSADALSLAEPEGYIRLFVDEGAPMAHLLSDAAARGIMPDYTGRLLAALDEEAPARDRTPSLSLARPTQALVEPLSQRELEVLHLIAQGLSNHEIGERLYLALSTVKGHNRVIFGKLNVERRTEAVARARDLGLL